MVDQTPKSLSQSVKEFCRSINPNAKPLFIPVQPAEHAARDDCFQNVTTVMKTHGGQILFGWAIWTWPDVWVKAEHHAVWHRDDDQMIVDITPHINGAKQILFLEDQSKIYDFKNNRRLDNIRKSLRKDPDIQVLFDLETQFHQYEETHTVSGLNMRVDPRKYSAMIQMKQAAYLKLLRKYLKRNDPCPCLSGKKLKKCNCGRFGFIN